MRQLPLLPEPRAIDAALRTRIRAWLRLWRRGSWGSGEVLWLIKEAKAFSRSL